MFKKLNHVQICISESQTEEARVFYSKVLGLKEIEKPESLKKNGGMWFEIADIQLHIGIEENSVKSKRHPAFEVEDLEQVREILLNNKITIKEETPIPGQKRFSFFDPFNNRIEVLQLD